MSPRARRARRPRYTQTSDYFHMLRRMVQAAGRRVADADVEDLRELVAIQETVEDAIRAGIAGLREDGYSWKSIGEGLGVTGQAVYMRYGKPKTPEKAS